MKCQRALNCCFKSSRILIAAILYIVLFSSLHAQATKPAVIKTADLKAEIDAFLAKEIAAHFSEIKTLDPPPDRVFQALTVGEFSWGSFARALAAQSDIGGDRMIAGKDTARAIAEIGLIEERKGGKAFSQLYSTLALRHYGTDLSKNAVWLSMNDAERKEWTKLLDATRFYDPVKRQPINLPDNYLGVAARVAAMSWQMGVLRDREMLDRLLERAAQQFLDGKIYADDAPPTGRYDRYSNEYARFCWDAADIAGRTDIKQKLVASLKEQMQLWWDIVSPAGYGYNWGRSQGLVSYIDTLEIAAFLGQNPQFRPTSINDLAAVYYQAWDWVRKDYNDDTHMFRIFDHGRGNYSYINPSREWQQAATAFGKMIPAEKMMMDALKRENIESFPSQPKLPEISRYESFVKDGDKKEGVWIYRKGRMHFAIPITVGTKPAVADYLPFPYGLPGVAAPVEEVFPAIVPFITLGDKKTYAASDGADDVVFGKDLRSLTITNAKWARIGSRSGERFENGLTTTVEYRVNENVLIRKETLTALNDTLITDWRTAVPLTASSVVYNKDGSYTFEGREGTIRLQITPPAGSDQMIEATGDGRLGKGVLGAIPFLLNIHAKEIKLNKGDKLAWELSLKIEK